MRHDSERRPQRLHFRLAPDLSAFFSRLLTVLPANRLTAIFATEIAMVRAYGCDRATVSVPTGNALGWSSLLLMRGGRFVKETRGGQQLCETASGAFFNRGEAYRVWHPDECGDAITEFVLHEDVLRDIVDSVDPGRGDAELHPFARREVAIDARAFMAHHGIWHAASTDAAPALAIEEAIVAYVHGAVRGSCSRELGRRTARGTRQRKMRPATRRARQDLARDARVILTHERRCPPSLKSLAAQLAVSPFHLSRVFREETGTSVHAFLIGVRLRRALADLAADGGDLAAVAQRNGFSDQSHMTRQFRRAFGLPPAKIRGRAASELLVEVSKIVQDDGAVG